MRYTYYKLKPLAHHLLPGSTIHISGTSTSPLYIIAVLTDLHTAPLLSVRHIFEDNHNWGAFRLAEKDNLRDVEIKKSI